MENNEIEGGYQVDFAAREVTVSPFKDALFFLNYIFFIKVLLSKLREEINRARGRMRGFLSK